MHLQLQCASYTTQKAENLHQFSSCRHQSRHWGGTHSASEHCKGQRNKHMIRITEKTATNKHAIYTSKSFPHSVSGCFWELLLQTLWKSASVKYTELSSTRCSSGHEAFSTNMGKILGKPEPSVILNSVQLILYFFAIIFLIKNGRVGQELRIERLQIMRGIFL